MLEVGNHLKDDFIQVTWHGWQKGNSAILDLNSVVEEMARLSEILGEISTMNLGVITAAINRRRPECWQNSRGWKSVAVVVLLSRSMRTPRKI